MTSQCNGCNGETFSEICTREDGLKIVRCQHCGLEFVHPIPDDDLLARIYQETMRSDESDTPYFESYISERKDREKSYERVAQQRLDLIERQVSTKGELLDIGCGAGYFLNTAKKRGWNVSGIEILPEYVKYASEELGLPNIYDKPLELLNLPENSFDVITMWDLIEHLQDPSGTLKEIQRVLRPGGLIVIWTPNAKNAAYIKERWFGYTISTHLYFFSIDSLKSMLLATGFETIYLETNKARKGFFSNNPPTPYTAPENKPTKLQKIVRGLQRDLRNAMNPQSYLSPLLDKLGYGFNLFLIAKKEQ